jgi:hypothetical protein
MRRGYWFLPRSIFGIPMVEIVKPWIPLFFQRLLLKISVYLIVGDYRNYGLQTPDHKSKS